MKFSMKITRRKFQLSRLIKYVIYVCVTLTYSTLAGFRNCEQRTLDLKQESLETNLRNPQKIIIIHHGSWQNSHM